MDRQHTNQSTSELDHCLAEHNHPPQNMVILDASDHNALRQGNRRSYLMTFISSHRPSQPDIFIARRSIDCSSKVDQQHNVQKRRVCFVKATSSHLVKDEERRHHKGSYLQHSRPLSPSSGANRSKQHLQGCICRSPECWSKRHLLSACVLNPVDEPWSYKIYMDDIAGSIGLQRS